MSIDWEVEYNNRARVPEHAEIFERWTRDGAAYRDEAAAERRAEIGLKFGLSPRQTIDLFMPEPGVTAPLALFVHGGYWRSLEPSSFSHMARGLNAHGVAVAVSGYDLVPQVTIADIITQTQRACLYLWWRFGQRIMVIGHSAGGHLAACMTATDWTKMADDVPADLVPAIYSVSGLFDLTVLTHLAANAEFKLDDAGARAISPLFWPKPEGKVLDAVVGGIESPEFLRHSRVIADAWKDGNETRYEAIPGKNHFDVLDPMADPASAMVERMAALCTLDRNAST